MIFYFFFKCIRNFLIIIGWTAWAIWRNGENPFKERYKKLGKSAKNKILQKKRKNSESSPGCILRFLMVLDLLGRSKPIKTQHFMIFRHFEIILIGILMILRQILFNRLESLDFFENFCRNYLKFVYLWKISILSMDMFLMLLNFFLVKFWDFFQILVTPCQGMLIFCAKLRKSTKNQHIWVHLSKEWPEFEKKSQNLVKQKFRSTRNIFMLKVLIFHK